MRTPLFDMQYLYRGGALPSRFGFVVSAKVDKRAVRRNRGKRLFRESVSLLLPGVRKGVDLVFWLKPKALGATLEEVKELVLKTLKKEQLIGDA